MVRTRTAPEPIEARTDTGTGLLVPIAKFYGHLATIEASVAREWPLSREAAAAELAEAVNHINSLIPMAGHALFTEETIATTVNWETEVRRESLSLTEVSRMDPEEPLTPEMRDSIRDLMRSSWNLLARIDREVTGVTGADPGRQP